MEEFQKSSESKPLTLLHWPKVTQSTGGRLWLHIGLFSGEQSRPSDNFRKAVSGHV